MSGLHPEHRLRFFVIRPSRRDVQASKDAMIRQSAERSRSRRALARFCAQGPDPADDPNLDLNGFSCWVALFADAIAAMTEEEAERFRIIARRAWAEKSIGDEFEMARRSTNPTRTLPR
jgi:hypothetical protein